MTMYSHREWRMSLTYIKRTNDRSIYICIKLVRCVLRTAPSIFNDVFRPFGRILSHHVAETMIDSDYFNWYRYRVSLCQLALTEEEKKNCYIQITWGGFRVHGRGWCRYKMFPSLATLSHHSMLIWYLYALCIYAAQRSLVSSLEHSLNFHYLFISSFIIFKMSQMARSAKQK